MGVWRGPGDRKQSRPGGRPLSPPAGQRGPEASAHLGREGSGLHRGAHLGGDRRQTPAPVALLCDFGWVA